MAPDPTDGRAKLVTYTERGLRCARSGAAYLHEVEGSLAEVVGGDGLEELRDLLDRAAAHLEGRRQDRLHRDGGPTPS